jgi:drug/metabolite transporter (DMT)-like permease
MMSSQQIAAVTVSASDWVWGVTFSVLASIIGGTSKLAIRKSWIIHGRHQQHHSGCSSVVFPSESSDSSEFSMVEVLETAFSTEDDGSPKLCTFSRAKAVSWFLYLFGMVGMSFLNPLCCVLAMQYANPSILAPFAGLTLVWVIMLSGVVLGEHPRRTQKVACALIVSGEVLVALFGDHKNSSNMDVSAVVKSYADPAFVVFMISMFSFVTMLHLIIKRFPKTSLLKKMAWGSIGGAITGFQNYLKDSLTIFQDTSREGGSLPVIFYVLFILAVATGFAGLTCLSACMKRYDATYASAMFVVSFVITASLMSAVHYHTFADIGSEGAIMMYILGLAVLIWGATILVNPAAASCTKESNEREFESDPEQPQVSGNKQETLLETNSGYV